MIYAQIKNGIVVNTIVVDDGSVLPLVSTGFDALVRTDNLDPQPGMRWLYDGTNFTPPPPVPYDPADDSGN